MATLISYNPYDQSIVGETEISTASQVQKVVAEAKKAFPYWRGLSIAERVKHVAAFREELFKNKDVIASLITQEMGKPIVQARSEVVSEIGFIDWYIEHAQRALKEEVIKETETQTFKIYYEPWGVCASIAPWNFPISMASSGIIQHVLAGNCVVFKPSEYTTLTQKMFIDLMHHSGMPYGVVGGVYGEAETGKALVDSDIDLLWFTGSTAVGQAIYKKCAEKFIKGVMELGGSSPGIIFADANLEKTIETIYWARFLNCGQVCSAVKRLFVEKKIFEQVLTLIKNRVAGVKIGNPKEETTDIGPLVSKEQLALLKQQIQDAKEKGAKVVLGGVEPKGEQYKNGNYFLPTLLTNVSEDMKVYKEETFGPVLVVIPFENETAVIQKANDTPYGLSAEIFTTDMAKANRIAKQLQSGIIGINTDNLYYPFCPIGGYKKSGMGREYGIEGFRELAQIKYVALAK